MSEQHFGHESQGVNVGRVLSVLGILALFVLVSLGVLHFVLHHGIMPRHALVAARPGLVPPAPRLQPHPDADLAAERAQKHQMLSAYAWTDASHQFARIPIQRAMQLYVQQRAQGHAGQPDQQPASGGTAR